MTLVRERRHQQALRLSLPPPPQPQLLRSPATAGDRFGSWRHPSPPSSTAAIDSDSLEHHPLVETLADLEKLTVLGRGSGGTVYKVRHRKTKILYALKVLRFDQAATVSLFHRQAACEAQILKRIDSNFIVKCYGVFEAADRDLCFVMELMERGSLHDALLARNVLTEPVISGVANRVLQGLHYLQGLQIVHGDIKPSNLLVNDKGEIKIADFGVSRVMVGAHYNSEGTCMGTCAYMSPERVDPQRWGLGETDGFAGDIWSLGVVVLECYVGHYPLIRVGDNVDWAGLIYAICYREGVEMPESASPEFRGFVGRCLEKDWRKRGTVDELLHHPFVNKDIASSG